MLLIKKKYIKVDYLVWNCELNEIKRKHFLNKFHKFTIDGFTVVKSGKLERSLFYFKR